MKLKNFLIPKFVKPYRDTLRKKGFKGFIKVYGWKVFAGIFLYYLIRDSILYILLPYLIAKGIIF